MVFIMTKSCFRRFRLTRIIANTVITRYCGDIRFLLDFHRDVDQLCLNTEVTSLYQVISPPDFIMML